MHLDYPDKKTENEIWNNIIDIKLKQINSINSPNILIQNNNLVALKYLIAQLNLTGKIDLVYIDPPFATNRVFKLTKERSNSISYSNSGIIAYTDNLTGFKFLEFLRERLVLLKMLLSDNGSIYVHTDYKIGHYVKIIMDEIFGVENFRNDITRIKCNPKNFNRKSYGNIKDLILFYSKSKNFIWNDIKLPYSEKDKIKLFPKVDKEGRNYTTIPLHAPGETKNGNTAQKFKGVFPPVGRHWRTNIETLEHWNNLDLIEWSKNNNPRKKIYFDCQEGKKLQDIWEFKDPIKPMYPTEKNSSLLNLIIKTSSNLDSIVLDCFAGSGTTLKVAQNNNRKWIGIEKSKLAIEILKKKLGNSDYQFFME